MKATLIVLVLAMLAVAAFAQDVSVSTTTVSAEPRTRPAIMGKPAANLKKPIIFAPAPVAGTPEADAPVIGKARKGLKKSAISEHIYGGAVEFAKGHTRGGCPCRKQLKEKFRYDTEFKAERKELPKGCHCRKRKHAKKPVDKLPVVAELRARFNATRHNVTNCKKHHHKKPLVTKIAPDYYPKRNKLHKLQHKPCAKKHHKKKPATVAPEFYPVRPARKHRKAARKAKKDAKKDAKAARKARKAARKAKQAARQARRAARKAARKAKREAEKAAKKAAKQAKKF